MNARELARGRCLGYGLLADVLAHGVGPKNREAARASRPLADAIDGQSDEALAVDLERALGWAAPPFEGAFLAADGGIGGEATDELHALFTSAGFRPDLRRVEAEHLATGLRALAFLAGAEADAIEDGHERAIERTRDLARALLDEHLLRWVPVWANAVRRVDLPFPSALATAIEELLLAHRLAEPAPPRGFTLPPLGVDPSDTDTDLRAVAEALTTPARSGLVLTRVDLERLGRVMAVPRGFGERAQVILNLLRSAARFEVFDALLTALEHELEAQRVALGDTRYQDVEALTAPWRERSLETQTLLRIMRAAAR